MGARSSRDSSSSGCRFVAGSVDPYYMVSALDEKIDEADEPWLHPGTPGLFSLSRTGESGPAATSALTWLVQDGATARSREVSAMTEDKELGARGGSGDGDGPIPVYPLGSGGAWLLGVAPGGLGSSPVISEPRASTPLESAQPDPVIPSSPLWAMKYLRHWAARCIS